MSPITHLRIISIIEALSFLYLAFCSIYLKRILGDDDAIKIPGWIHGILFCIYCRLLYRAMEYAKWSLKTTTLIFLTSLVPIIPFLIEPWLKKQDQESRKA